MRLVTGCLLWWSGLRGAGAARRRRRRRRDAAGLEVAGVKMDGERVDAGGAGCVGVGAGAGAGLHRGAAGRVLRPVGDAPRRRRPSAPGR